MTTRHTRIGDAVLFATAVALGGVWAHQVRAQTTFDRPPSESELESALGLGAPKVPGIKKRSLVIDQGEVNAPAPAPRPAPASPVAAAVPARPVTHAPAPAPTPAAAAPAAAASGEKTVAMRIMFDYDSAAIRPDSEAFISPLADILKKNPQAQVVIVGHTDASGSFDYNTRLSQRRANAVRDDLVNRYGIDAERLSTIGKGPSELQLPDDPTNPKNRRVEFKLRNL